MPLVYKISTLALLPLVILLLAQDSVAELSQKQIHQEMLGNARANVDFSQGKFESARVLWETLADMGNAHAMYSLGVIYRDGLGVVIDELRAFRRFEQAAQQGEPRSLLALSEAWRTGMGTRVSVDRADDLLRRAAFAGVPEAQLAHGITLAHNRDLQERAWYWLNQARTHNMSEAEAVLTSLENAGYSPVRIPGALGFNVARYLEEMDAAINSRDADIYAILFAEECIPSVRLPGEAENRTISCQSYLDLWQQTFDQADRLRAHRGEIDIEKEGDAVIVTSEIQQYTLVNDSPQQLVLKERLALIETPYGFRANKIHLEALVSDDPLLAP